MATSPMLGYSEGTAAEVAARLDRLPTGPWHRRVVALMGIGTFFNFFEVGLGSLLVTLVPAGWVESTVDKSLVIGSAFVGELLGALFLAPLSDRFGRRRMFQVNLLAYAGLSLVCTLAPGLAVFLLLRVLVGVGLGAELVLVDTYLSELVPAARRGRLVGMCYFIGWLALPASAVLAAFLPHTLLGIESWRWLLIFSALGAALVWFTRRGLSESPRWLAAQGRRAEALAVLREIEGPGNPPAERPSIADSPAKAAPIRPHLLRRPLLGRTALACLVWACQTIGVLGFSSIAPLVLIHKGFGVLHSLGYTAATACGFPLGAALVVLLAERFQRKHLLVLSSVLVAASGATFGLATSGWLVVAAGTALNVFNVVMGNLSHAYTPELFPTAVRTTAAGRTYSLSRLVSAVFPFAALPLLYSLGAGVLFSVCAVLILAMSVGVAVFGPRTNARQLDTI